MNKKMSKRQKDIKSKLMAAICMLLVSSIMMVSSTYAWFTLSTAPEVTGIQTAVGANGNLEMALLPISGDLSAIDSKVGDSMDVAASIDAANRSWGNLVDLQDTTTYGLNKIMLYPAQLNAAEDGKTIMLDSGLLKTPKYGADGRVSAVTANTNTAIFNGTGFYPTDTMEYGVRAVGTVSDMTDRQLSFRSARAFGKSETTSSQDNAKAALVDNGSTLANIALQYANNGSKATFTQADVAALKAMISGLEASLQDIDDAYKNYILAFAASSLNVQSAEGSDDKWRAVQLLVNSSDNDLATVVDALAGEGVDLPDLLDTAIADYNGIVANVEEATEVLAKLEQLTTITWSGAGDEPGMSDALLLLANPDEMKINGYFASEVKANMSAIINDVTAGKGITVTISEGGGAFVDIAEHVGDYSAEVTVNNITISSFTLETMKATMVTQAANGATGYLGKFNNSLTGKEPSGSTSEAMPLSDMYGYVVDLAFRTNASASDLQLQVEPADRIYDDNSNEDTMGGGSYMTFTAADNNFTTTQMKNLMDSIRIVFFDPTDGAIIANAGLNTANATVTTNSVTAFIEMQSTPYFVYNSNNYYGTIADTVKDETAGTETTVYTFTDAARTPVLKATVVVTTADDDSTTTTVTYTDANGNKLYNEPETEGGAQVEYTEAEYLALGVTMDPTTAGAKIMPLGQNTATGVSVLVYLDGTTVKNADVAYSSEMSMTGSMNLQFSSSATLVPMEYSDLHITGDGNATEEASTESQAANP